MIKRPRHLYQPRMLPYDWIDPIPSPLSPDDDYDLFLERYDDIPAGTEPYGLYVEEAIWWLDVVYFPRFRQAFDSLSVAAQWYALSIAFSMVEDIWGGESETMQRYGGLRHANRWTRLVAWWFHLVNWLRHFPDFKIPKTPYFATPIALDEIFTDAEQVALSAARMVVAIVYPEEAENILDDINSTTHPGWWRMRPITRLSVLNRSRVALLILELLSRADYLRDISLYPSQNTSPEELQYNLLRHQWKFLQEWAGKVQAGLAFQQPLI